MLPAVAGGLHVGGVVAVLAGGRGAGGRLVLQNVRAHRSVTRRYWHWEAVAKFAKHSI